MSCEYVQERISPLLDAKLAASEREHVLAHLESCGNCTTHFACARNMRTKLLNLPQPRVPGKLASQLRVMASHESARRAARRNIPSLIKHWVTSARLAFDNLMRPFAVPVTGGVTSAFVIFSLLVPSLSFPHTTADDPPLEGLVATVQFGDPDGEIEGITGTRAVLENANAVIYGNEVCLTLLIDEYGRVQDYYLSSGKLTEEMKSIIMLSKFKPAMVNGQPSWGLKQVVFTHHRMRT